MPQDPAHDLILTRMDASSTAALDKEPDSHTAPHHTMSKQAWVLSKAGKPLEEKADRSEHNNQPAGGKSCGPEKWKACELHARRFGMHAPTCLNKRCREHRIVRPYLVFRGAAQIMM